MAASSKMPFGLLSTTMGSMTAPVSLIVVRDQLPANTAFSGFVHNGGGQGLGATRQQRADIGVTIATGGLLERQRVDGRAEGRAGSKGGLGHLHSPRKRLGPWAAKSSCGEVVWGPRCCTNTWAWMRAADSGGFAAQHCSGRMDSGCRYVLGGMLRAQRDAPLRGGAHP